MKNTHDHANNCWAADIERFYKYRSLFRLCLSDLGRSHCIARMTEIKNKYPVAMKNEALPV